MGSDFWPYGIEKNREPSRVQARLREKAGLDEHSTVWQVSSGAATGTFLTFTWYRSDREGLSATHLTDATLKAC